jgi:signal transduction histidine kinase
MAPPRRRKSALLRLAIGYAAFFCGSVIILSLLVHTSMQDFMLRQARGLISEEIDAIRAANNNGLIYVQAYLKSQTERTIDRPFNLRVYLLVDEEMRCPDYRSPVSGACPIGNVQSWPDVAPDANGWVRLSVTLTNGEAAPIVAKVMRLRRNYHVLVGQNLSPQLQLTEGLAQVLGLGAILTLVIGGLGGWFVARRMVRRVDNINTVVRGIGPDGLGGRLPQSGPFDEFGELNININGMLDRISDLINLTRSTTDQIAHDLRTPLARLRMKLERLNSRLDDEDDLVATESAIDDVETILNTFAAILEIAKNEGGDATGFARLDLESTVDEVLELYQPVAEDAGLTVRVSLSSAPILGSDGILKQMLANLIDNAIKFSPPGGDIGIELRRVGGDFELVIADQGKGIPPEMRANVFERFFRGAGTEGISGHGLGLSLVQAVARRHSMTVELEDNDPGLKVVLAGRLVLD